MKDIIESVKLFFREKRRSFLNGFGWMTDTGRLFKVALPLIAALAIAIALSISPLVSASSGVQIQYDVSESWGKVLVETEAGFGLNVDMDSIQKSSSGKWLTINGTFSTDFHNVSNSGTKYFGISIDETLSGGYLCYKDRGSSDTPTCKYKSDFTEYEGKKQGFDHIYYISWSSIPDELDKEFQIKVECNSCDSYPRTALIYFGSGSTTIIVTDVSADLVDVNGTGTGGAWDLIWDKTEGIITGDGSLSDKNGLNIRGEVASNAAIQRYLTDGGDAAWAYDGATGTTSQTSPMWINMNTTLGGNGAIWGFHYWGKSDYIRWDTTKGGAYNYFLWYGANGSLFDYYAYGNLSSWGNASVDESNIVSENNWVVWDVDSDTKIAYIIDTSSSPEGGRLYWDSDYSEMIQLMSPCGYDASEYGCTGDLTIWQVYIENATTEAGDEQIFAPVRMWRNKLINHSMTTNITEGILTSDKGGEIHLSTSLANISTDFYIKDGGDSLARGYNRSFLIRTSTNTSDVYVKFDGTEYHFGSNDLIAYPTNDTFASNLWIGVYSDGGDGQDIIGWYNFTESSTRIRTLNESFGLIATEAQGDTAIENGINSALNSSATIYTDQQVYARNITGGQGLGTFDKVAVYGNKRWAFNYVTIGESLTNLFEVRPVLYVKEISNQSSSDIESVVEAYILETLS